MDREVAGHPCGEALDLDPVEDLPAAALGTACRRNDPGHIATRRLR
jgi:hypothetical protein